MKRSHGFLWGGALFVGLVAIIGVVALRLTTSLVPEYAEGAGPRSGRLVVERPGTSDQRTVPAAASVDLDFGAVDQLECSGSWKVVLVEGPEGRAKLTMPSRSDFLVKAQSENGHLQLSLTDISRPDSWSGDEAVLEISMPHLSEVRASGSSNLALNRVQTPALTLYISGSSSLTGSGRAGALSLFLSGSSAVEFSGLVAQKIDVEASGTGNLTVNAGGPVGGRLSGVVALKVKGTPSDVRVETSGLSSVTRD